VIRTTPSQAVLTEISVRQNVLSTVLQGFYQSHQATAASVAVHNLHLLREMILKGASSAMSAWMPVACCDRHQRERVAVSTAGHLEPARCVGGCVPGSAWISRHRRARRFGYRSVRNRRR
jgi:hypothetical protein